MYGFSNEAWAFIKIDRFFMTYFDQSHDSLEGKAEEYEEYSKMMHENQIEKKAAELEVTCDYYIQEFM